MPGSNQSPQLSAVEQTALAMGMPARSEHKRRANLQKFEKDMLHEAGVVSLEDVDDAIAARSESRANRRPSLAQVATASLLTGAVIAASVLDGNEPRDDQRHVESDEQNQEANIQNNPELFVQDMPAATEMTVSVESEQVQS